jgi:DNA polymerase-1
MAQLGMERDEAIMVEERYHLMYSHSDEWVASKIEGACRDGYVTVAFGLRVRTPLLKKTILKNGKTPYEAQSESRTAGNALGQSYGMLNNRAGIEFQERTLASKYRLDIKPIAHIHDAQYFLIRDDIDVVEWVNTNLVECMEWQDLSEIAHPDVKLGGALDVFSPSWANAITLPNGLSAEEIQDFCTVEMGAYLAKLDN